MSFGGEVDDDFSTLKLVDMQTSRLQPAGVAGFHIACIHLGVEPLERQSQALAHDAYAIDGVDVNVGFLLKHVPFLDFHSSTLTIRPCSHPPINGFIDQALHVFFALSQSYSQ